MPQIDTNISWNIKTRMLLILTVHTIFIKWMIGIGSNQQANSWMAITPCKKSKYSTVDNPMPVWMGIKWWPNPKLRQEWQLLLRITIIMIASISISFPLSKKVWLCWDLYEIRKRKREIKLINKLMLVLWLIERAQLKI